MLNGWQRLWLLMCAVWGVFVVSIMFILTYTEDELGLADSVTWSDTAIRVLLVLTIWVLPCMAIYVLGVGMARWRRGHKGKS